MGTKVQAKLSPSVEVALGGNGSAAGALVHAVADVLREGGGTNDGRLVDLSVLPDVVGRAVAGDGADLLALSGASTIASVLLDVVLDKRVLGPAVNRDEDRAGLGLSRTREVDIPGSSGLPALADDKVTSVGELDGIAVVGGAEVDIAAGLVVLVVVLAADETGSVVQLEVGKIRNGSRDGEGASSYGKRGGDGGECNHFDCWRSECRVKNGNVNVD